MLRVGGLSFGRVFDISLYPGGVCALLSREGVVGSAGRRRCTGHGSVAGCVEGSRTKHRYGTGGVPGHLVEELEAKGKVMSDIGKIFIGGDVIRGMSCWCGIYGGYSPGRRMVVTYGPTEGTIFCTDKLYEASVGVATGRGAEIGRPIANARIYMLDARGAASAGGRERGVV